MISAGYLGKDLGKPVAAYARQATALKKNIDRYFGGTVEGFDTYKYYEGNDVLRSWICIPLTVGIQDRKDATIQALFSPRLWTENGLLTQAGSETFWDRSTLYALRGVYACGETEKATDYLRFYSSQRLLGEHVPYAIEAWPEGNAPSVCRKRFVLPYHYGRDVRHSSDRPEFVCLYSPPVARVGSYEPA